LFFKYLSTLENLFILFLFVITKFMVLNTNFHMSNWPIL